MTAHYLEQIPGRYRPILVLPKVDRETGAQKKTREGVPQWSVDVLYLPEGTKSVKIEVTVPGEEAPSFAPMQPAHFAGLRIDHYAMANGPAGVFFKADAISALKGGQD